jgi:hypothetical protein
MQQFRIEDYHDASTPQLDPNQNVPEIRELIDKYKKNTKPIRSHPTKK